MQRTSKRVPSSAAIPSALKPHAFKPSSVLSSDVHWRKTVKRKTKGSSRTMKRRPGDATVKPSKVVTSEYIDKFVEWDIPEMYEKMQSIHNRNRGSLTGGALTGVYENDLMVADWQSEQKRSYIPLSPEGTQMVKGSPKVAGLVKPREGSVSSAFMWDDEDRLVERPYEG